MYIYLTDRGCVDYSISRLREDNPQVSFPSEPNNSLLASYNVFPLTATAQPSYDPITQNLTEGTPALVGGVWTQVWDVTAATPEEVEQRKAEQLINIREQRAYTYAQEADPLFFKAQRGEATMEEWDAKVQEIRYRFPYPAE